MQGNPYQANCSLSLENGDLDNLVYAEPDLPVLPTVAKLPGSGGARAVLADSLLMKQRFLVIIHSDQGSQYGSDDWLRFLKEHDLKACMSRRGNCYDNAVAETFFSSLKKERIWRKIYATRAEVRADIFDYIEVFYNRTRRHSTLGHARRWGLKHRQNDLTHVLPRPVEIATQLRHSAQIVVCLGCTESGHFLASSSVRLPSTQ